MGEEQKKYGQEKINEDLKNMFGGALRYLKYFIYLVATILFYGLIVDNITPSNADFPGVFLFLGVLVFLGFIFLDYLIFKIIAKRRKNRK